MRGCRQRPGATSWPGISSDNRDLYLGWRHAHPLSVPSPPTTLAARASLDGLAPSRAGRIGVFLLTSCITPRVCTCTRPLFSSPAAPPAGTSSSFFLSLFTKTSPSTISFPLHQRRPRSFVAPVEE